MRVALTLRSENVKTGPIPVSTSSSDTCPKSCPLKGHGCYAETGKTVLHWRKVDAGARGTTWRAFIAQIRNLPKGTLWRHNVAGDLPGRGDRIDEEALRELAEANRGLRGFTYTHKPVTGSGRTQEANRRAIRASNEAGFTVNLSADNPGKADELADLGIAPVVAVVAPGTTRTPGGRRIVVCPAQTHGTTCQKCQLCARVGRGPIVGFLPHGARKRAVLESLGG